MQTERMLRTRRSASRLVSSSIWRRSRAESWRTSSSISLSRICLAWEIERLAMRSSSRRCWFLAVWSFSRSRSRFRSRSAIAWSRRVRSATLASIASSLESSRSSMRTISARRSRSSSSMSSRVAGAAFAAAGSLRPRCPPAGAVAGRARRNAAATTMPAASSAAAITIAMSVSSPHRRQPAGGLRSIRLSVRLSRARSTDALGGRGGRPRPFRLRLGVRSLCSCPPPAAGAGVVDRLQR